MRVLNLRASRQLLGMLVLLHAAALAMALLLTVERVPFWAPLLALVLTVQSSVLSWRLWRIDGSWRLKLPEVGDAVLVRGAREERVEMLPGCVDFAGIWVVLRWRVLASGKSRAICLMADSTDPGSWRRLRIWLRWRAFSPDPSSASGPWASEDF